MACVWLCAVLVLAGRISSLSAPDLTPTALQALNQRTPCPGALPVSAHPYANLLNVSWTNTCAGARALEITFDPRTVLEGGFDYLYITDAAGRAITGSPLTGNVLAGKTLVVPGATAVLRLETDGAVSDWGVAVMSIVALGPELPPSLVARQSVTLLWTVDVSGGPISSGSSYDAVYVATNSVWSSNAVLVAFAPREAQSTYAQMLTISAPNLRTGNYYLILRADAGNSIAEANEANNDLAIPIHIDNADLAVVGFSVPAAAAPQERITISWTVTNLTAFTAYPDWSDYAYVRDGASSNLLESVWRNIPLPGHSVYSVTQQVVLRSATAGTHALEVHVNQSGLAETILENNVSSAPISVVPPDLVALSATAPLAVNVGDWFEATVTISNSGTVTAYADWYDVAYVSTTNRWTADAVRAGYALRMEPLAAGMVYTQHVSLNVPATRTGDLFLLFVADGLTNLFDAVFENNVTAVPLRITAADLMPLSFHSSRTAASPNQPLALDWIVQNRGNGQASGPWMDSVLLAADSTGTNIIATVESSWRSQVLPALTSYTRTQTVHCPAAPPGDYFFVFKSDAADQQPESNENNNVLAQPIRITGADLIAQSVTAPAVLTPQQPFDVTWTVRSLGPSPAYPGWEDTIYIAPTNDARRRLSVLGRVLPDAILSTGASYTLTQRVEVPWIAAGSYLLVLNTSSSFDPPDLNPNNFTSVPIRIVGPDLVAVDLSLSASASGVIKSSLLISNAGPVNAYPAWQNYFYLSPSNRLVPEAVYLGNSESTELLAPGSVRLLTPDLLLADIPPGSWYVVAQTMSERLADPNLLNNEASAPITVSGPDLVPQWLENPAGIVAAAQEPLKLHWTIGNRGNAKATPRWDDVITIKSKSLKPDTHIAASVFRLRDLDAGDFYTRTGTVTLPPIRPGRHELHLYADGYSVIEESSEANNEVSLPVQIISPDLVIQSLQAPPIVDGQSRFQISWRVQNRGPVEAFPSWVDRVFVSTTNHLTSDAVEISFQPRIKSLPTDRSYSATASVTLPRLTGSNYFLIVKTDADTALFDPVPENNEMAVPIAIKHPDLIATFFSGFREGEACAGPYAESPHPYPPHPDLWRTNTCPGAAGLVVRFSALTHVGDNDFYVTDGGGNGLG